MIYTSIIKPTDSSKAESERHKLIKKGIDILESNKIHRMQYSVLVSLDIEHKRYLWIKEITQEDGNIRLELNEDDVLLTVSEAVQMIADDIKSRIQDKRNDEEQT